MSSSNISSSDVCSTGHNPCYLYTDVVDNQVAYDAVVMLVNNNNPCAAAGRPLVNITKTAIKNAFQWRGNLHPSGVAPTWDSLCPGSVLAPIVPRFRDIGSGTRASFDSFIGLNENGVVTGQDDEQSTATATSLPRGAGNPDMVNFVAANPNQISYVGLAFAAVQGDTPGQFSNPNTYALAYDSGNGTPIQATTANVKSFAYGMSRFLHMYTINQSVKPDAPAVDYVNWILGPKGQALVDLEGFVPITTPPPAWDVNTDHVADIGDVVAIGSFWTQTAPLNYLGTAPFKGWLRQDANADGSIDIGDVVYVGGHWQATW
jgi:ABC-type phosphate transport system substrate-binding protein